MPSWIIDLLSNARVHLALFYAFKFFVLKHTSKMALQSTSQKAQSPPPSQLRHRPLARAATSADMSNGPTLRHRRSSLFSDNVSEARRSFRSSVTDDLYPRANGSADFEGHHDTSHWNSVPLVLALLPAVGGLLFNNGSAVVTDITLLALAAIFLNWSLRLPWYVSLILCV